MKKSSWSRSWQVVLMLTLVLALAACSSNGGNNSANPGTGNNTPSENTSNQGENSTDDGKPKADADGNFNIADFSNVKTNRGEPIQGGSITFGLVGDSPFEGTLNFNFYSGAPDAEVLEWFDEGLLTWDSNYVYTNDGAATYEVSEDGRTFTFTIRDNVNWHDGVPVTAEDWEFAHEVISHPDYNGPRYGSDFTNIEGVVEYHEGKADKISGIKVLNDKQLQITYIKSTPSLLTGGVWIYPLAKHIFKDIPVADMAASPQIRQNPIGIGPFKVESIVPGESVVYKKNTDYWRGEPLLDEVILKVIPATTVVQELKSGGVDLVSDFPVDQYPDNADMSNVEFLGIIDRAYSYIGFKLGTWDAEKKEIAMNPNAKMADVNLRKAMWQAVDNDQVGKKFYKGLRWGGTTLIPPSHPDFHDASNPGVTFDIEAAKKTLDDAGYAYDGEWRTNPDGSPLEINFISMTGSDISEPLAQYYVQSWAAIGLKVNLEMVEFNTFYTKVGSEGTDDPNVDVYMGAWTVGIDVDPTGLYGHDALYNFPRWESEENDRLLAEGVSEKAFDVEYRKQVYKEWQQYMVEQIPVFPTLYRSLLSPVNERIVNYAIGDGTGFYRYNIGVTEDKPVVAK
ncbi:oligopeptide ABC transporter substrate-binding protein [Paenibacillus antibioticophila]|uniref:oligopeptide ABC transporter substrate-binding protein n=1 Tax=Paenibacillus antibioticophila TaxID=1274374 RepID=UPI0005C93D52|nr:oligopeptide ABC transporter substrate-binding protein [Paenibacillus antibioticophila]